MGACSSHSEQEIFTSIVGDTLSSDVLKRIALFLDFYGPFTSPLPCIKRTVEWKWRRDFYPLLGSYAPIPGGEEMISFREVNYLAFDIAEGFEGAKICEARVHLSNLHTCKVFTMTHEGEMKTIEISLSFLVDTVIKHSTERL